MPRQLLNQYNMLALFDRDQSDTSDKNSEEKHN